MKAFLRSKESAVLLLFGIVFAAFAFTTESFATRDNLLTVARQYSEVAVVSVGLMMIIVTGGIDISVGSMLGLSSILIGVFAAQHHMNVWLACALGIAAGTLCGAINGLVITRLKVQPIVATLAMMSVARGLANVLSNNTAISGFPDSFAGLGETDMGPIPLIGYVPLSVVVALALVVIGAVVLRGTSFGRQLYAVGANEEAARLSGIHVLRIKMLAYTLTGLLCGLGGIMMTARAATADPRAGTGLEFEAITAVVMGGSSLRGGEGSIIGTIIGVAVMGVLRNGVSLRGVNDIWQVLFLGTMLIVAVLADNLRNWIRARGERVRIVQEITKAEA